MVVDFQRKPPPIPPVNIHGFDIEVKDRHKFFDVYFNKPIDHIILMKGQSWSEGLLHHSD